MAPLFHFRRCRPAVSSDSHICPDVWLSVDTDQLFLRTKGRLREGRQKEAPQAPQSTSSLASTTPFSNAGSSRQSTEGQLVSCLWPGMGALRKWQAVFKAKSSAPASWRSSPPPPREPAGPWEVQSGTNTQPSLPKAPLSSALQACLRRNGLGAWMNQQWLHALRWALSRMAGRPCPSCL